jgi:dephospho-CoA kinase
MALDCAIGRAADVLISVDAEQRITMLIVGLTGGIASGKSLVARVFKDRGAYIIDADRIVHDLLGRDQPAWQEVIDYFGGDILQPDKRIDRRKLGEIVFLDERKRTWLNNCLHPKVFDAFTAQAKYCRNRQPSAIVVFDAALLIETGYYRTMDKIVVVYADQDQQVERLISRDGFTREHALARIRSQMPLAQKRTYADYVIENTDSRRSAERRAEIVFDSLKQDAERL